jgi:hypothetical protein
VAADITIDGRKALIDSNHIKALISKALAVAFTSNRQVHSTKINITKILVGTGTQVGLVQYFLDYHQEKKSFGINVVIIILGHVAQKKYYIKE